MIRVGKFFKRRIHHDVAQLVSIMKKKWVGPK